MEPCHPAQGSKNLGTVTAIAMPLLVNFHIVIQLLGLSMKLDWCEEVAQIQSGHKRPYAGGSMGIWSGSTESLIWWCQAERRSSRPWVELREEVWGSNLEMWDCRAGMGPETSWQCRAEGGHVGSDHGEHILIHPVDIPFPLIQPAAPKGWALLTWRVEELKGRIKTGGLIIIG